MSFHYTDTFSTFWCPWVGLWMFLFGILYLTNTIKLPYMIWGDSSVVKELPRIHVKTRYMLEVGTGVVLGFSGHPVQTIQSSRVSERSYPKKWGEWGGGRGRYWHQSLASIPLCTHVLPLHAHVHTQTSQRYLSLSHTHTRTHTQSNSHITVFYVETYIKYGVKYKK